MSEITIAQPLSGVEVIDAVLARARVMMLQDCYLSPNSAYESFEADLHIKIRALDIGRVAEAAFTVHEQSETPGDPNDEDFALREAEAHMGAQPPNQVRRESGQAIPTLVDSGDGKKEVKHVKYQRKTEGVKSEHEI